MDIKPIRNDSDLAWAIDEVAPYFESPPEKGTAEADRFDVLSDLIEAYEARHFPAVELDPVEFLQAFMDMTGRTQTDLGDLLSSRSRASEILHRKRRLTVDMIFKLGEVWGLPAECLIKPYKLEVA
ncbi:XRE family transcriptional regulator [Rhizobium sp. BE258]|jgi:HTH-type transcriptional regulator/antitoxin HigA|uniref:helix-turn-helix domain-containing protein n=1 Tax=Rhizobium sp. BE258 TaxID=2817722 RepID=UPI00285CD65E|nr:XRE family transcriptional regulator [Rhizobium sp. BE258]MDR7144526.1 HTH-type transcriptional regulator/antitoxin HigA [Rhizobium sp. BE258]